MTERMERLLLGLVLLALLVLDVWELYVAFVSFMFLEALTPWRLPVLVNLLRKNKPAESKTGSQRFGFEAERLMRLAMGSLLLVTIFFLPHQFWIMNWIIATFMAVAGLVGVCPSVIFFRWVGFR